MRTPANLSSSGGSCFLQSMEGSPVGGKFHPGKSPHFPPPRCPMCHGIMGDSDSVSAYYFSLEWKSSCRHSLSPLKSPVEKGGVSRCTQE